MGVLYTAVKHSHAGLRWIVLALLIAAIVKAIGRRRSGAVYTKDKLALFALISTHIQLVLGLLLYLWLSPYGLAAEGEGPLVTYFNHVHLLPMIAAVAIITIGWSKSKRQAELNKGWKTIATHYGAGLAIILLVIPWPFYPGLEGIGWT